MSFSSSPFAAHDAPLEIDFGIGKVDHFARVGRGAPQDGADARHQFARAERLHHIIVGADLEQQHFVHFVAQPRSTR